MLPLDRLKREHQPAKRVRRSPQRSIRRVVARTDRGCPLGLPPPIALSRSPLATTPHEHQPVNHPAVVRIVWPVQSTIVNPKHFPEVAAMLTRLFAEAATTRWPKSKPGGGCDRATAHPAATRLAVGNHEPPRPAAGRHHHHCRPCGSSRLAVRHHLKGETLMTEWFMILVFGGHHRCRHPQPLTPNTNADKAHATLSISRDPVE